MSDSEESRRVAEQLGIGLRGYMIAVRRGAQMFSTTRQQLEVLGALSEGPRRVTDLADELGVRMPTMTTQLARLERDGLVTRARGSGDARVVMVSLTKEGKQAVRKGIGLFHSMLTKSIERLSPEERRALAAAAPALQKVFPLQASLREGSTATQVEKAAR